MDYDEYMKKLRSFGKFQKRLLVIIALPVILNAFGTPVSVFFLAEQMHRCKLLDIENDTYEIWGEYQRDLVNKTIPRNEDGSYKQCSILVNGTEQRCSEWVYDQSVFTLTVNSQFNLVCDDDVMTSHAVTAYFVGLLASALTMSPLGDVFGRRFVICVMRTLSFFVNIAMPFSPSIIFFTVMRFLDGYTGSAFYNASFILGMEFVGPAHRLLAGTLSLIFYCAGEFILILLAYFIRDWRWLQLTLAIPMILPLTFWWPQVLPESPRWLLSRGRTDDAMVILRRVARVNKVEIPDKIKLTKEKETGMLVILKELIYSKTMVCRMFLVTFNWFSIAFIYYGLTINVGKFRGDIFMNFAISVLVEFIGYCMCFFLDLAGRKPYHLVFMYGVGLACLASIFPLMYGTISMTWMMISFCMLGKFAVSAAFGEIYIYTGELFPTVVRSLVMSVCNIGARTGSIIAPYLYLMADGKFGKALPLILYGVAVMTAATFSIILPETRHRHLPQRVKDAEGDQCNSVLYSAEETDLNDKGDESNPLNT